tara:strand:- start:11500 stop:12333 length:834 start_codon:yes stop_codon:yes gene_type:complete
MSIVCDRCGRDFKKMDNLRRHLNRVYICQPILADIPIESLRVKYACKKGVYECENCGKLYKTSSGKCKHKKTCIKQDKEKDKIIQEKDTLLKEALAKIDKEQQSREKLEQQVRELLLQKQCVQNITNNNFIIQINNYGEENMDYLRNDANFLQKCVECPIQSIQKYLDAVHFNKDHPENSNIKLTNLQSPFMDYFKNGNWSKIEQRVLIPKIIHKSVKVIHSLLGEEVDEHEESSSSDDDAPKNQKWYQYMNEIGDPSMKQKIKVKAKSFIYNRSLT